VRGREMRRRQPPHVTASDESEGAAHFANFPCVCLRFEASEVVHYASERAPGLYRRHDGLLGFVACTVGCHSAVVVGLAESLVELWKQKENFGHWATRLFLLSVSPEAGPGPLWHVGFVAMKQATSFPFS
jgi:hypothetical protein